MENQPKHKLAEWLDRIQQDSWQLELVISGFAIFLMLGAMKVMEDLDIQLELAIDGMGHEGQVLVLGFGVLMGACFFFLINLILHVVLRGVWISAVGLRSVSGDIDYESLRLSDRFNNFLQRRIGSFDAYIERLENLCSIVFAFTFLIVFMLLAVGLWAILLAIVATSLTNIFPEELADTLTGVAVLVFIATGLIYLIDFATLGWLKRIKWLAPFYLPLYRFYSALTLAPLYRPIYYNLIDNKFGRRAAYMLVPYIFFVMLVLNINASTYVWFPDETGKKELTANHYGDLRKKESLVLYSSIPSKFVSNNFLEVFIRYRSQTSDKVLELVCPNFKPLKESGFTLLQIRDNERSANIADTSLMCLSQIYRLKVDDSIYQQPPYRFYQHPGQGEKGILAVIDIGYLPRGENLISIEKLTKAKKTDSLYMQPYVEYPFWKE